MEIQRKLLPISILPLDPFGECIANLIQERINLIESELINCGWLRIFQNWGSQGKEDLKSSLLNQLVLDGEGGASPYTPAVSRVHRAIVIPIGSLSLHRSIVLENITTLHEYINDFGFRDQIDIHALIDVSEFAYEEAEKFENVFPSLVDVLEELNWRENVYLADNTSEGGIICDTRDGHSDAISLFLEAFILGDHWDEYEDSWVSKFQNEGDIEFASFSILSLQSVQSSIVEYLTHVSYYETLKSASISSERQSEIFSPESLKKFEVFPEDGKGLGFAEDMPKFYLPDFFEMILSKKYCATAVEKSSLSFRYDLMAWHDDVERNLSLGRVRLEVDAKNKLDTYRSDNLIGITNEMLQEKNFISVLDQFRNEITKHIEKFNQPASSTENMLPLPKLNLDTVFEPHQSKIWEIIPKLPNLISFTIHTILLIALLVGFGAPLLNLWKLPQNQKITISVLVSVLYLASVLYVSFRFSSLSVRIELKGIAKKGGRFIKSTIGFYNQLMRMISDHINRKNQLSILKDFENLAKNLQILLVFWRNQIKEEKNIYPYPEISVDNLNIKETRFKKMLEIPKEISNWAELHYKDTNRLLPLTDFESRQLVQSIVNGNIFDADRKYREFIQQKYEGYELSNENNLVKRIKIATISGKEAITQPLLSIKENCGYFSAAYCARPESWAPEIEKALGSRANKFKYVSIKSDDRIYYYRVIYKLNKEDLLFYKMNNESNNE